VSDAAPHGVPTGLRTSLKLTDLARILTPPPSHPDSYNGNPTAITTIYDAVKNASAGSAVTFALGSNATCGWRCGLTPPAACWDTPGPAADAMQSAVAAAAAADVTILAVGLGATVEAEGCDRFNLTLPAVQQELQRRISKVAKKLILVVVSAGGVDFDDTQANAVVWAPYGGQAAGPGVVDVLRGWTNPSARLPLTFYKQSWFDAMTDNISTSLLSLDLEIGVGRTHRYVASEYVKYGLGFGLSYGTAFKVSGVTATKAANGSVSASATVSNSGTQSGRSVVQAYLSGAKVVGQPVVQINLVGFEKVLVLPGTPTPVQFIVDLHDTETAMADGSRSVVPGAYTLWICDHHPLDTNARATLGTDACASCTVTL
jgi:beta-glucosidase